MKSYFQTSLRTIVIFLAGMMPLVFYGQDKADSPFEGYLYLSVNGGITQYYGDLNKDYFYSTLAKPAFGFIAGYQISPLLGVRGQFMGGKIEGEKNGYMFISHLWDGTVDLSLNISNLIGGYKERIVSCYGFGGAGIASFSSRLSQSDGTIVAENGKRYNKDGIYEFVVPVGIGANLAVSQKIDFNVEYGNRFLFTDDKLDLTYRKLNDHYGYISLGLTYNFFLSTNMWNLPRQIFFGLFHL